MAWTSLVITRLIPSVLLFQWIICECLTSRGKQRRPSCAFYAKQMTVSVRIEINHETVCKCINPFVGPIGVWDCRQNSSEVWWAGPSRKHHRASNRERQVSRIRNEADTRWGNLRNQPHSERSDSPGKDRSPLHGWREEAFADGHLADKGWLNSRAVWNQRN